jgi:hypothetical protein
MRLKGLTTAPLVCHIECILLPAQGLGRGVEEAAALGHALAPVEEHIHHHVLGREGHTRDTIITNKTQG